MELPGGFVIRVEVLNVGADFGNAVSLLLARKLGLNGRRRPCRSSSAWWIGDGTFRQAGNWWTPIAVP